MLDGVGGVRFLWCSFWCVSCALCTLVEEKWRSRNIEKFDVGGQQVEFWGLERS